MYENSTMSGNAPSSHTDWLTFFHSWGSGVAGVDAHRYWNLQKLQSISAPWVKGNAWFTSLIFTLDSIYVYYKAGANVQGSHNLLTEYIKLHMLRLVSASLPKSGSGCKTKNSYGAHAVGRHVIFFVHKRFLELHSKTDVAFWELTEVDWDLV